MLLIISIHSTLFKIIVIFNLILSLSVDHNILQGYYTTKAAYELAQKKGIKTPIIKTMYEILYENLDPKEIEKVI